MATYKISKYSVGPSEEFFFDTCVWLYIFAPLAGARKDKQIIYSKLYGEVLSRGATIWINSQVVAEYINRYLRLEFDQWKKLTGNPWADFKKDFRPTSEYQIALQSVKSQITAILQKSERIPDDFHSINISAIINSMGTSCDYGDAIIINLCNYKKFKLVTDDSDMTKSNYSFSVLTA
jgi:hypothetical protein